MKLIAKADWATSVTETPPALGPDLPGWFAYGPYTKQGDFLRGNIWDTRPDGNASGGIVCLLADQKLQEAYVEFKARIASPEKGGGKFCKFFGQKATDANGEEHSANATYGLEGQDHAKFCRVSFGDGKQPGNDTAQCAFFDRSHPDWLGRSEHTARILTSHPRAFEWDDQWHTFRFYFRYNSGSTAASEIPDGAFYVNIDGTTYLNIVGLYNRHWSDPGVLDRIGFGEWVQNTPAHTMDFKDIYITTGGFYTAEAPMPTPDPVQEPEPEQEPEVVVIPEPEPTDVEVIVGEATCTDQELSIALTINIKVTRS